MSAALRVGLRKECYGLCANCVTEDVQATKQQIRQLKNQDVASTRNALRIAAQAEETGRGTLARLGEQGERIHNTEKNLDLASSMLGFDQNCYILTNDLYRSEPPR